MPILLLAAALPIAMPSLAPANEKDDLQKVEEQIQADKERARALEKKRKKAAGICIIYAVRRSPRRRRRNSMRPA